MFYHVHFCCTTSPQLANRSCSATALKLDSDWSILSQSSCVLIVDLAQSVLQFVPAYDGKFMAKRIELIGEVYALGEVNHKKITDLHARKLVP